VTDIFDFTKYRFRTDFEPHFVDGEMRLPPQFYASCTTHSIVDGVRKGGQVFIPASPSVGGWAQVSCDGYPLDAAHPNEPSDARIRFGEAPNVSPFNHMMLSLSRHVRGKARICPNENTLGEMTVGLVGVDDPANIGGAALYRPTWGQWVLQTRANGSSNIVKTGFQHAAGQTFDIEIQASPTSVKMLVNGEVVAESTQHLPTVNQAWEFQVWNRFVGGAWTAPSLWIDVFAVEQNRV
jgi:hypothetical protein